MVLSNRERQAAYQQRKKIREEAMIKALEQIRDETASSTGDRGKRLHVLAQEALA